MNMALSQDPWRLAIGDPTPLGWLTFAAYGIAAALCWRAQRVSARAAARAGADATGEARQQRLVGRWWLGLGILMLLLGLNKQADLQTLMTVIGKDLARAQGWYASRARVQTSFVVLFSTLLACGVLALLITLRGVLDRIGPALLGLASILLFIALRALALHALRNSPPADWPDTLWPVELAGIGLVVWNASRASRTKARRA